MSFSLTMRHRLASAFTDMTYIDSHAHYFDERFANETAGGADALLAALFEQGLTAVINVGTSPATTRLAISQAEKYPRMLVAAGIHPSDGQSLPDIDVALDELDVLLSHERVVALGEIGLDYHYDDTDKALQSELFHRQMQLAREKHLPVIIHDREAHGDVMDVVRAYPDVRGVFHSYSGSTEMARELLSRGYYISFSGTVTFKNARKVAEVAAAMPHDLVLVETDCPYLAPHPHRGELNHSGLLPYTVSRLAELWGISPDECAAQTARNADELFGIRGKLGTI